MFGQLFSLWGMKEHVSILFLPKYPFIYKIGVNLNLISPSRDFLLSQRGKCRLKSSFFNFFNLKRF